MTPTQLSLQMSLTDSVTLREEVDRCEAYAQAMADENARLRAANAKLLAQVAALKKEQKSWKRSYTRLKAERDQLYQARLSDAQHPLHDECKQLRKEVDELRAKLFQRVWQELEALRSPGRLGTGPSKADLTKLISIAHPDLWQTRPATELSHEITVVLNDLRSRLGVG